MSTTEKMKTYNDEVVQIAKIIQNGFYGNRRQCTDPAPHDEFDIEFDANDGEWLEDEELMERAEKVYQYFPCVEEARKVLNFLQMANPVCGKMFVEHL